MSIVWAMLAGSFIASGIILGVQVWIEFRNSRGGVKRGQR